MQRLLITGATGSMAPFLIHRFLHEGPGLARLLCLARGDNALARIRARIGALCPACAERVEEPSVEVLRGDLEDGIPPTGGSVDAVWHYAADLRMRSQVAEEVLEGNRRGTRSVLAYCEASGATLHYVSTAYVCGRRAGVVMEDDLAASGFRNAYEQSKAENEARVRRWLLDHPGMIFRPSIVVGDTRTGVSLSFRAMYKMIWALWFLGERARASGGGEAPVDLQLELPCVSRSAPINLVGVDYATGLMLDLAGKARSQGGTFHVVNPTPPTLSELVATLSEKMHVRGIRLVETRQPDLDAVEERARKIDGALAQNTGVYFPYVSDPQPEFDMRRVKAVCGDVPPHPAFDLDTLGRMVDYAIEREFRAVD